MAVENTKHYWFRTESYAPKLMKVVKQGEWDITGLFCWSASPQGFDYWDLT